LCLPLSSLGVCSKNNQGTDASRCIRRHNLCCLRLPSHPISLSSLVITYLHVVYQEYADSDDFSSMTFVSVRSRYAVVLALTLILATLFFFRVKISSSLTPISAIDELPVNVPEDEPKPTPLLVYKNVTKPPTRPIVEYFPLAAKAKSRSDLPSVPKWNKPPRRHVKENTVLFIGFTRNWPLLQQAVVGYITAGWPPEDIIVVENTGVMDANEKGKLTLQNPFFLDHHRLKDIFGVKVMVTPVLYTFSQLQNLYLHEAIKNGWPHYLWSHMDVLPQSREDQEPYRSMYQAVVDAIRKTKEPGFAKDSRGREGRWALQYFAYDWLTLMNTAAMVELGGWDVMISYYTADCDLYDRMRMLGLSTVATDVGDVWDMYESLPDLEVLYRVGDTRNSSQWHEMQATFHRMQDDKNDGEKHPRNDWQITQSGGQGEPFYRDPDGFVEALGITIDAGVKVYHAKWGGAPCNLRANGLTVHDAWKVDHIENMVT
jgi:hypothetical protein